MVLAAVSVYVPAVADDDKEPAAQVEGGTTEAPATDGSAEESARARPEHTESQAEGAQTHSAQSGGEVAAVLGAQPVTTPPARRTRRRFSWPMRIFLGFMLFDMIVRSTVTLTPFDDDWRKDLDMVKYPTRLPTPSDVNKIVAGKDAKYGTVRERYWDSATSVLEYASPIPTDKTRKKLEGVSDYAKYVTVWVGTRLSFFGALSGVDQNWPMFSPNVRRSRVVPRAKLIFEDGSSEQLWLLGEPWDLTSYSRWLIKRPLQIDLRLYEDYDARLGVSRHLAQRFPYSHLGSPLKKIEFYRVYYRLPKPDEDAYAVLVRQNRKKLTEPFWRYNVDTRKGDTLTDDKERAKKERERKRKQEKAKKAAEKRNAQGAAK